MKQFTFSGIVFALSFLVSTLPCHSEENEHGLGLKEIGVTVGLVKPSSVEGTFSVAGIADIGEVAPNVFLFPQVSFWQKSEKYSSTSSDSYKISEIGLQSDLHYYFPVKSSLDLYVGAGTGLFILTFSDTFSSYSLSQFGFSLLGGIEFPLSEKVTLTAELKQKFTLGSGDGYSYGGMNTFGINAGIRIPIG
jgi:opacity protein-like surface antigen